MTRAWFGDRVDVLEPVGLGAGAVSGVVGAPAPGVVGAPGITGEYGVICTGPNVPE